MLAKTVGAKIKAPRRFRGGAGTPDEVSRVMPGDRLIEDPTDTGQVAVTVDAPPEDIWPWLVQIGYQRGGLYSYDWLDRLFGFLDRPSATRVLPEFQQLAVGDRIPWSRFGTELTVKVLDEPRALALGYRSGEFEWVWQFGLYPLDDRRTRFISRGTEHVPRGFRWWLGMRIMEPAAFIMTRRFHLGVKQRAEALAADTDVSRSSARLSKESKRACDLLRLLAVVLTAPVSAKPVRPQGDEARREMAGDELTPHANLRWTHAITIAARPEAVWPWLAQMGCRRAGWYSYDALDNGGVPSAERVISELQGVKPGDIFPMTPTADQTFVVRAVEHNRALVIGDPDLGGAWQFTLEPHGPIRTRLLVRATGRYEHVVARLLAGLLLRPIHFGMERRQLLGIKRRVEERAA